MAKEFISLGFKEKPPRIGEYEKEPEEGAVKFEKKSLEELTKNGEQRMEAAAAKVGSVKESIVNRFNGLFSKAKGVSTDALRIAFSTPEIKAEIGRYKKHAVKRGKALPKELYESTTEKVNNAVKEAGVYLNEKQQAVVNKASDGYKWFENGAAKALTTFKTASANIMEKVEQRRKEKEKEKDVLDAVEARTKWLGFEELLKDKYGLKLEKITNE